MFAGTDTAARRICSDVLLNGLVVIDDGRHSLEASPKDYGLASLRYDLSKIRAKGLVERVPRSPRYRLRR